MTAPGTRDFLSLAAWRRTVAELYASIRTDDDPARAWESWCAVRRDLFSMHPDSPIPADRRHDSAAPHVFAYEPSARAPARVELLEPLLIDVDTSDGAATGMWRFARAAFALQGHPSSLDLYWIDGYGGGLALSFRDATNGDSTYGGGRYLLDSIKGADLGTQDGKLVLDFNFAYQPSCSYDPRWSCPLPPPGNELAHPVEAGERMSAERG